MKIPDGPNGHPTLSASQFRTYGASGFALADQEDDKGCPSLYYRKYVSPDAFPKPAKSYELRYGSMFHSIMYRMEDDGLTPDEALTACFDLTLPPSALEEARKDLDNYMARGAAPQDRYGTLAVEAELSALLYVDPEFGPIYYRGVLDWIGVDPDDPTTIHIVDYKTNRSPISVRDVEGDVQTRGYHWLVRENADRYVLDHTRPNIVTHLDAIKFSDIEYRYSDAQIDDWRMWAIAVARAILRDEVHEPRLNTRCDSCPVNQECDAFARLPKIAADVEAAKARAVTLDARVAWRDEANRMRLILEKSVKAFDAEMKARADETDGGVAAGGYVWRREFKSQTVVDLRALHAVLRDRFYDVISTSKAAVERLADVLPPSTIAQARGTFQEVVVGTEIVKRKA